MVDLFTAVAKAAAPSEGEKRSEQLRIRGEGKYENDREMEVERRVELRFFVSEDLVKRIEEAKCLLSGKFPQGVTLEHLFGEALEVLLDKVSPERREKRRAVKAAKKSVSKRRYSTETAPGKCKAGRVKGLKRTRHIPQELRDRVWVRDGGRCTFVGVDGVRCNARHDLEVHHEVPFGRGGVHSGENLRLLCRKHNGFRAEMDYGERVSRSIS